MSDFRIQGVGSSLRVRGENNVDYARGQGGQIHREVRLLRRDFERAVEEQRNLQRLSLSTDSPYAPDRKTIDRTRIKGNLIEGQWRKVEDDTYAKRHPLAKDHLKKLNIL